MEKALSGMGIWKEMEYRFRTRFGYNTQQGLITRETTYYDGATDDVARFAYCVSVKLRFLDFRFDPTYPVCPVVLITTNKLYYSHFIVSYFKLNFV